MSREVRCAEKRSPLVPQNAKDEDATNYQTTTMRSPSGDVSLTDDLDTSHYLPLRKRPSLDDPSLENGGGQQSKEKVEFAMTSCNSAFLEDLFDDIAVLNGGFKESSVTTQMTTSTPTTTTVTTTSQASKGVSDYYNLAKRRRVSTTTSLEPCSLASTHMSPISTTSANNKTLPHLDLPATVSASYSFQLEPTSTTIVTAGFTKEINQDNGDFGWFVFTDLDEQEESLGYGNVSSLSVGSSTTTVPLAFSAPTAPLAATHANQAAVEWAKAADTVDEVLGDFF